MTNRKEPHWIKVLIALDEAVAPQMAEIRPTWAVRRRQVDYARAILRGPCRPTPSRHRNYSRPQIDHRQGLADGAARIYPTSADDPGRAGSGQRRHRDVSLTPSEKRRRALQLDDLTPHTWTRSSTRGSAAISGPRSPSGRRWPRHPLRTRRRPPPSGRQARHRAGRSPEPPALSRNPTLLRSRRPGICLGCLSVPSSEFKTR